MSYSSRETTLPGVVVLTPSVHADDRGFFYESYRDTAFAAATGANPRFVQDNHSQSVRGVLRGLHYQLHPHEQGKLVRCTRGSIWDVAVDVTRGSATLGRWFATELSQDDRRQLWIPSGYAHGFLTLSDVAEVQYKTTAPYAPESEASVLWSDPSIGIDWPLDRPPTVSAKDAEAPILERAKLMGE